MAENDRKKISLTDTDRKDIALEEYNEVLTQFRKLTDIRFTLLTYLPLGTVFAAVFGASIENVVRQRAISVFAFVVTMCIATYDKRNDQHYDELVSRAAELERELQIEHGSFSDRPKSWLKYGFVRLKYGSVRVEHRWPIGLIYVAAAGLWAYMFVDAFSRDTSWLNVLPSWPIWLQPGMKWLQTQLGWMKLFVPVVVFASWLLLRSMEERREKEQRNAVKDLMEHLLGPRLQPHQGEQAALVEKVAKKRILDVKTNKAERRIAYHWNGDKQKWDPRAASALLAAVTDLPARWIEDVWTGRR
jgi:hypothetical protein